MLLILFISEIKGENTIRVPKLYHKIQFRRINEVTVACIQNSGQKEC